MSISRRNLTNSLEHSHIEVFLKTQEHSNVHLIDMPFRITSIWQEQGCKFGVWEKDSEIIACAVFQPAWRNLDYAISLEYKAFLEQEVIAWGKEQIQAYAERIDEIVSGHIEFFEDDPHANQIITNLQASGFTKTSESTLRFKLDLRQSFPQCELPNGLTIRLLKMEESQAYQQLIDKVFAPPWMTSEWHRRVLAHPSYVHILDLVAENAEGKLVGFCTGWVWQDMGQIEPLGVHPDYRGLGLGRALELTMIESMQYQGGKVLFVDHGSTNDKAIALSRTIGFHQHKTILRYFIESR